MIKTKKQMFALIGAFILTIMLGTVTYAFFNYTRTGSSNTIKTGRISFNHTQGNSINLTNMFPIDVANGIPNDNTKVGEVIINVTGDTTYGEGIEYLVTAVNVTNTVGSGQSAKELPISINVSVENNDNNDPVTSLGTEDEEYFDNRGVNASTSIYKVLASGAINEGDQLLVGYIKPGATGVDGNIVIKAYIDKDKVVISDTYPAEVTDTNSDGYLDGTPTSFGEGKTVFTTTEWNSLQTNGVSFQVKVESREGTWVEEIRTINAMNTFPSTITNEKANIKEVYFNKMGATRMQQSYDAATIKADLTYNNEGKVLAWLEENQDDNTMYNLIIASDGDTYLTTGNQLFAGFNKTEKILFNNINTSRVINMNAMFAVCQSLTSLDLSDFDTSSVETMSNMFVNCTNLENINISSFNTENVTDMSSMFNSCQSLTSLDLSNFDTSNVTSMYTMFVYCPNLITIDLSSFDTSNVTSMETMFASCQNLTTIYVSNSWNMNSVSSSNSMFADCTSLVGGAGTTFDSSYVDKTYAKVDGGPSNPGYLTLKTN